MPSMKYKTKSNKIKWMCRFYYTDKNGKPIEKKKEGFNSMKEADEWERNFLTSIKFSPDMTFKELANMYLEDIKPRIKLNTLKTKEAYLDGKIYPYFEDKPINEIKPITIRTWQNEMLTAINPRTNQTYSPTYLKSLHTLLSAIFTYAVKYHGLSINPCSITGSIGSLRAEEMHFWTYDDFNTFIDKVDREDLHLGFNILYWSGMRIGELLALTWEDFDDSTNMINIDKSYQRIDGKDVITPPKSKRSIRKIVMPVSVMKEVKEYKSKTYKPNEKDRLFIYTKRVFEDKIKDYANLAGLKPIRLHDLRHSHASLLIHHDINVVVVSRRLGHEKVSTTLDIYSHLFPDNQDHLSDFLNLIDNTKKEP